MGLRLFLLMTCAVATRAADGDPLHLYLNAVQHQNDHLRGLAMEVEIEASLPRLRKNGRMHALRYISRIGAVTYRALTFQGDQTVKKDVIARYLQAEKEAWQQPRLGITPENYKIVYRGLHGSGDWRLHLFSITPKQKRVGLFRGWLWVEASTGMPVREQGELVKSPSIFLRKVSFVRDYELRDGIAWPVRIDSSIHTRLVGTAQVVVTYSNIRPGEPGPEEAAELTETAADRS